MKNAFTIDLEDYYHVSAFAEHVDIDQWGAHASRVEANTARMLDMLDAAERKATFFVLGWVARKNPKLIRQIAERGHEIACHSMEHRLVYSMSRADFREDTRRAVSVLEDAAGTAVRGYRAPSFSITTRSPWAFEVLAELGFTYDSSIFPVRHISYGVPDAPRKPYRINTPAGELVEFPMPTLEMAGRRSPLAGGAYLRLLPYWYTQWGIRFLNKYEQQPVCVYVHPWELDPEQPRMDGHLTSRLRHYIGLQGAQRKITRLLRDFEFCPLGSLVMEYLAPQSASKGQ